MTHLFLIAEAMLGADLRRDVLPEMAALARTTGTPVKVRGNGTTFLAYPDDTAEALQAAFDRLYPASTHVAVKIHQPMTREPAQADPTSTRYAARFEGPEHVGHWRVRDTKWNRWAVPRRRFITEAAAKAEALRLNKAEG